MELITNISSPVLKYATLSHPRPQTNTFSVVAPDGRLGRPQKTPLELRARHHTWTMGHGPRIHRLAH